MSNVNNEILCQSGFVNHNLDEIFICNECNKFICLKCLVKHYNNNFHKNDDCYQAIKDIQKEVKQINDEIVTRIKSLKKIIEKNNSFLKYYEDILLKNEQILNK